MVLALLLGLFPLFLSVNCDYTESQVHYVAQNLDPRLNSRADELIKDHWNQELVLLYYGTYFSRADVALHGFGKFFHRRSLDVGQQRANITTLINKRGGYVSFRPLFLNAMCETIEDSMEQYHVSLNWMNKPYSCSAYICRFLKKDQSDNDNEVDEDSLKYKWKKPEVKDKYKPICDMEQVDFGDWRPAMYALRDLVAMENTFIAKIGEVIHFSGHYGDPFMRHSLEDYLEERVEFNKTASGLIKRLRVYEDADDYALGEYLLDHELQSAADGGRYRI